MLLLVVLVAVVVVVEVAEQVAVFQSVSRVGLLPAIRRVVGSLSAGGHLLA